MSTKPAVSIITPVWNGLPFLKECLRSVLDQNFQNWEMLIGDNGSTDGTSDYLAQQSDPRIQIYKHEFNRGICGNLNFLFTKANAPIAYILCADDYFYPGELNHILEEWGASNPNVAFITFSPDVGHSKLRRYTYNVLPKNIRPAESRLAFFLFGNFTGNLSNVSVKVSAVNDAGGFLEHLKTAGDFEMWCRLSKKNELVISDRNVVFVREHLRAATHYMTQKGEDYAPLIGIYEDLLNQLSSDYSRKELVSYLNTQITPQYFRTGIKYALAGRITFLKTVLKTKSSILWNSWKQFLICTPLSLSESIRENLGIRSAKNFILQCKKRNGTL